MKVWCGLRGVWRDVERAICGCEQIEHVVSVAVGATHGERGVAEDTIVFRDASSDDAVARLVRSCCGVQLSGTGGRAVVVGCVVDDCVAVCDGFL